MSAPFHAIQSRVTTALTGEGGTSTVTLWNEAGDSLVFTMPTNKAEIMGQHLVNGHHVADNNRRANDPRKEDA